MLPFMFNTPRKRQIDQAKVGYFPLTSISGFNLLELSLILILFASITSSVLIRIQNIKTDTELQQVVGQLGMLEEAINLWHKSYGNYTTLNFAQLRSHGFLVADAQMTNSLGVTYQLTGTLNSYCIALSPVTLSQATSIGQILGQKGNYSDIKQEWSLYC